MWFNIFNPFVWFSMFNPPAQPGVVAPTDEEDLPEDFDLEIDEDFEEESE
jgi:hypothetical protein